MESLNSSDSTTTASRLNRPASQPVISSRAATISWEQDLLLRKIRNIQTAVPAPVDQAVDMLRLTSRASELFLQQPAAEQHRLLHVVCCSTDGDPNLESGAIANFPGEKRETRAL
jgi:hypothetical protein